MAGICSRPLSFAASKPTVPGKKRRGFVDDHRYGEAKGANVIGEPANLFLRMRVRVARVGLDRVKAR